MATLTEIVKNSGKGFVVGAGRIIDPIGGALSNVDYWVSGAGPSNRERALPTVTNQIYQNIYSKPEENLGFWRGYVPRFLGEVTGTIGTGVGLLGIYATFGPVAAFTLPVAFGIYDTLASGARYVHDFIFGERVKGKHEKASFKDGFRYGYHESTHLSLMRLFHEIEEDLTGRGLDTSHVRSSIMGSANAMRRNFSAILGSFMGVATGLGVSILSLGIVPFYKSTRDALRTIKKSKKTKIHKPSFVT